MEAESETRLWNNKDVQFNLERYSSLIIESNMINLNVHWVNGKTYKKLFEEGLDDNNHFLKLYHDFNLLPVVFMILKLLKNMPLETH